VISGDVRALSSVTAHVMTYVVVTSELEGSVAHAKGELAAAAVILVIVIILSPVVFLVIHRMTLTIQNYALGLSKKTKELRREKKRSDTLLYQMLPKSVALQLKLSKKVCISPFFCCFVYKLLKRAKGFDRLSFLAV